MLTRLEANDAAFDANRRSTGNGAKVVDLESFRHRGPPRGGTSFAHGLIEQRGDDAAVQIAGRALKGVRNNRKAYESSVFRAKEFEVHTVLICRAATEASVVSRVGEGREVFVALCHAGLADWNASDWSGRF